MSQGWIVAGDVHDRRGLAIRGSSLVLWHSHRGKIFAMRGSWLYTLVLLAAFGGSVAVAVAHHARYLRRLRPPGFFEFLETGGWVLLASASGAALHGIGSGLLLPVVATVGILLVALGRLLGGGRSATR